MLVGYQKTNAIVIGYTDYSNTSRIFRFYTERFGRITALAKGVKRRYSRMIGQLDLFASGEIVFISGRRRDRMNILTEAAAFETFHRIRRELPAFYAACHAAELVGRMTAEEDPSPELFGRLRQLLRRLDRGVGAAVALFAFEAHLLVLTGFMPEVSKCVACGKAASGKTARFAFRLGGIICRDCAGAEDGPVDEVPLGGLRLLANLAGERVTRLERIRITHEMGRGAREFLNRYEEYVLGGRLRTAHRLWPEVSAAKVGGGRGK
jgi:DNA repair protein RecO (recombination protein O)